MSVNDDHWTNHLTSEEEHELDAMDLEILGHKDAVAAIQKERRKMMIRATGRMRRSVN